MKKKFDRNVAKFSRQSLEELLKNYTEASNNFREKLQKNSEEIFEWFAKLNPGIVHFRTIVCKLRRKAFKNIFYFIKESQKYNMESIGQKRGINVKKAVKNNWKYSEYYR